MKSCYYDKRIVNALEGRNLDSYRLTGNYFRLRRLLDITLSVGASIVAMPIVFVTGVVIKIEDNGPIFYIQERVGQDGKVFKVYKLRSMIVDAEKKGAQWADKNDSRVTRVGAFIRKTRIDELPQLLNILRGDMSIIGPRPERPDFTVEYNDELKNFVDRLVVKPGLTGWAQVNGGYDITPKQKLDLDLYYLENKSLSMDLKIVLKTVKVVFTGEGSR